jgi:hypothetical protein
MCLCHLNIRSEVVYYNAVLLVADIMGGKEAEGV